ncbi:MAG: hypothetical protein AMS21_01210 [Gemmatimonas sp. SG8_38_2]|nr:MAG: hypothetical protein AMS21_01210 [Gemmatimonas sp. SG8_38_2]
MGKHDNDSFHLSVGIDLMGPDALDSIIEQIKYQNRMVTNICRCKNSEVDRLLGCLNSLMPDGITIEWRCTRDDCYTNHGASGHYDERSRQGHYVTATTRKEAIERMRELFPDDTDGSFTVNFNKLVPMQPLEQKPRRLTSVEEKWGKIFQCPFCHSRNVRLESTVKHAGWVYSNGSCADDVGERGVSLDGSGECYQCHRSWNFDEAIPWPNNGEVCLYCGTIKKRSDRCPSCNLGGDDDEEEDNADTRG